MPSSSKTEWVLGPQATPFYTREWIPSVPPLAHIVFIHGYIEHVDRYVPFFNTLSSSPHNIHIVAYDQRGFGRTSRAATPTDHVPDEVLAAWKKEGKTVKSARGNKKTSWAEQMEDAEFFVKRCLNEGKGSKVFLMGQSMGGGLALAFATRTSGHPSKETVSALSGVIALSPLITLTRPQPEWKMWLGAKLAPLVGSSSIPTPLNVAHLSHDPTVEKTLATDPLCREQVGSLKGVADMLTGGRGLVERDWRNWPKDLPLLVIHGEKDLINSAQAAEQFVKQVQTIAMDANVEILPGLYHEIHNESAPAPAEQASRIATWIRAHTVAPAFNAATLASDEASLAEDQSMTTMRTEGGERVIGAEVDRAARRVAKVHGEDGYSGEHQSGVEDSRAKL